MLNEAQIPILKDKTIAQYLNWTHKCSVTKSSNDTQLIVWL